MMKTEWWLDPKKQKKDVVAKIYEYKVKKLSKIKLFRQENIHELCALIKEIEVDNAFEERIKDEDDKMYTSTRANIEAVAQHYRAVVRCALMMRNLSPADTSDLSI